MSYTGLILPNKKPRITHKKIFSLFVLLVGLYIVGALSMMVMSIQKSNNKLAQQLTGLSSKTNVSAPIVTPDAKTGQTNFAPIDKTEATALIEKVSSLALVPEGESPTLAVVLDTNKLAEDLFFRDVQKGDRLLVYQQAGVAILYRPSIHKLIALGNINTRKSEGQAKGVSTQKPVPTIVQTSSSPRIAVYYVEESPERKAEVTSKLGGITPAVEIVSETKVKSGITYDKTTIIDLKGGQEGLIAKIAKSLGGVAGNEAQGETLPSNADILVIVAK